MAQSQNTRRLLIKSFKTIMKSYRVRIPKYENLPVRLRPWFLIFTCVVMITLAFLGFTNFSRSLPLNDKALHFLCFGIATGVFYFIFDVEEDARRIWFWRHSALIFTAFVCFFCGGILSEFVQSMLPYKEFQFGDVVANLLGSSVGLLASYHMERYYRKRREIARLYQPLDTDYMSDLEDDDDPLAGTQLLPTHHAASAPKGGQHKSTRITDVWDEREEFFGIGGDSDDEDAPTPGGRAAGPPPPSQPNTPSGQPIPKIFLTASEL